MSSDMSSEIQPWHIGSATLPTASEEKKSKYKGAASMSQEQFNAAMIAVKNASEGWEKELVRLNGIELFREGCITISAAVNDINILNGKEPYSEGVENHIGWLYNQNTYYQRNIYFIEEKTGYIQDKVYEFVFTSFDALEQPVFTPSDALKKFLRQRPPCKCVIL